ncbi:MAG: class IV adenylate cyclase [Fimbriiglobus sp.]
MPARPRGRRMLEVEAKFRAADWDRLRADLAAWGAVLAGTREDVDHYFNAPDRDFRQTDEAVRLRRIGPSNFLTYKGPKRDAETKTRTEVEVPLADGPDPAALAVAWLTGLGYRSVAVVTKTRTVYRFHRDGFGFEACLDDVPGVGRFVELEITTDDAGYPAAKAALLAAAAALGLTEQERRSYLAMTLGQ